MSEALNTTQSIARIYKQALLGRQVTEAREEFIQANESTCKYIFGEYLVALYYLWEQHLDMPPNISQISEHVCCQLVAINGLDQPVDRQVVANNVKYLSQSSNPNNSLVVEQVGQIFNNLDRRLETSANQITAPFIGVCVLAENVDVDLSQACQSM